MWWRKKLLSDILCQAKYLYFFKEKKLEKAFEIEITITYNPFCTAYDCYFYAEA